MIDFDTVLDGARHLSSHDQMRLMDALWGMVPDDADLPLHPDWRPELERRVAAVEAGTAMTVPWATVRDEALARVGHGKAN